MLTVLHILTRPTYRYVHLGTLVKLKWSTTYSTYFIQSVRRAYPMVSRGRPSLRDFVPYNSPARPRALLHCNDEVLPVNASIAGMIGFAPATPSRNSSGTACPHSSYVMLAGDRDLKGGHGPSDRDGSRRMGGYQGKTVRDHPTYSLSSLVTFVKRVCIYKQTHNESMTAF